MSTKSTILNTPWCHVYSDYAYQHTCNDYVDGDVGVVVVDVDYGSIPYDGTEGQETIVVRDDSEFAKMIIWMCEQYKASHNKVEGVDINGQHEPLITVLNALDGLGNNVEVVDGVLTIKAK